MKLTLLPIVILTATATAQGWGQPPSNNYGQQPNNYQPGPPGGQWSYQGSYGPPQTSDFPNLKQPEIDAWRSCTNHFLQNVNDGVSGSRPACNFWECLHIQASRFGRGGLLTSISNILNPVCDVSNAVGSVPVIGGLFGNI